MLSWPSTIRLAVVIVLLVGVSVSLFTVPIEKPPSATGTLTCGCRPRSLIIARPSSILCSSTSMRGRRCSSSDQQVAKRKVKIEIMFKGVSIRLKMISWDYSAFRIPL